MSGWSSPRALSTIARARRCIASASAYFPWAREGRGQVVVAGGGVGVVLAQGLAVDRQGAAVHRLGLGVLPLVIEGHGQVGVASGGVGVLLAQGLEPDRQGAAVHRLGLGVLALGTEGRGQVVVAVGGVGVALAQGLEADRQGAAVHRLGLGVLPLGSEGHGQVVVAGGGVGVVLAQDVSTDRESFLEQERGLGILAAGIELIRPRVRLPRLHVAILDLTGQAGEALVGLEVPAGVAGLPVVLAPGACEQVELLPGGWDGLGDLARVEALVDCAVELLDTLRQVGVRSGRGRGRRVLTVKPGEMPSTEGRPGPGPPGRPRAIGGETTAWFTSSRSDSRVGTAVKTARCRPGISPGNHHPTRQTVAGQYLEVSHSTGPYFMMSLSGFTGNATARTRVTPGDRRRRSQRSIKTSGADSRRRISPRSLPRTRLASESSALS